MKYLLALITILFLATSAIAQGYINPPIYATGYIYAQPAPTVNTIIRNSINPNNLNILAGGNITTWNITLPSPPFDGQVITIGCPSGTATTLNILSSDGSTITPNNLGSCISTGIFLQYQYNFAFNTWLILSSSSPLPNILDAPLDQIANIYAIYAARRVVGIASQTGFYKGPLYTIQRESDNATMDVYASVAAVDGWPSKTALQAWRDALGSSTALVTEIYDESGNARHITCSGTACPLLNLDGPQAIFDFDGVNTQFTAVSQLGAFVQNVTGASIIAVRRHDSTQATDRPLVFFSTNAASSGTRLSLGPSVATGAESVRGRRLDADTVQQTVGFTNDTNWAVEVATVNYTNRLISHYRGSSTETLTPFETSGSTTDLVSLAANIGYNSAGVNTHFNGKIAVLAFVSGVLTTAQASSLITNFNSTLMPASPKSQFLKWNSTGLWGNYTLAPGLTNVTVMVPDGTTPAPLTLTSHRYHHHTRITVRPSGRLWIATTSGLDAEDKAGQMQVLFTSTDGGVTWTAPISAVPSQSVMADGATPARIIWSRAFVTYGGNLYLVSAVQSPASSNSQGLVLIGTQCNDDGSVGTPFLVSTDSYTALSGITQPVYDPVLGPALFPTASLYGPWGGSNPGFTPATFGSVITQDGGVSSPQFVEPATFSIDGGSMNLQRLWRKLTGILQNNAWSQLSTDGGATWSPLAVTDIPDAPSAKGVIRLPDGRTALVGNPNNRTDVGANTRDPLYLALFDTTGSLTSVYAVRQGISPTPTYAGAGKVGGAAYPDVCTDGTNLYVSYSLQKESVGFTKIPISGL